MHVRQVLPDQMHRTPSAATPIPHQGRHASTQHTPLTPDQPPFPPTHPRTGRTAPNRREVATTLYQIRTMVYGWGGRQPLKICPPLRRLTGRLWPRPSSTPTFLLLSSAGTVHERGSTHRLCDRSDCTATTVTGAINQPFLQLASTLSTRRRRNS
jgi:hypothetical protein